ncbi:MAG TPA: patatin-like phospholipase family protein [Thermoanaerobaculia bacterium]|nr:patatin-like phospholipase family protein [Thermoanaerobaculia bacterium]
MRRLALSLFVVACIVAAGCRSSRPAGGSCDCAAIPAGTAEPCRVELSPDRPPAGGPIENLVFEGGGVKGTAYAGALRVLGERGLLEPVRRVGGTSAGSITALLVALGYTPEEVVRIVLAIDYGKFRDGRFLADLRRLFDRYGWYEGDYAECLFRCLVERRLGAKDATFADLHERARTDPAFKDLYVVATNLDVEDWVVFSHEDERYRDVPLAAAVRASMSIPFYFAAPKIGGDTFVDGGVLNNYPIGLFSPGGPPTASTLGFFLGSLHKGREITGLEVFTEEVFGSLVAVQVDQVCRSPEVIRRTVFIDPLGIRTTDFSLTQAQKCALIRSGAAGMESYFRSPPTRCPERLRKPPGHGAVATGE